MDSNKPRYRISLRERSIKRNTDDDPGGRNAFCSDECWKRAEWVRRWVLSDDLAASTSKGKAKERDANSFRGEDRTVLESGRFEKRWTEEQWHEIELLEDMDVGQLNILMGEGDEEDEGRSDVGALMGSLLNGHYTKPSASETAAMIDSLVIHERSPGKPPERAGAPAPSPVSHASISHGGSAKPTTKTPSKWTTDAPSLQSPHTQVRGGIGLNDLMGGYVGTSTSSSLVRDIQAISRRGQALANATSKASHGQLQYESDMDGSDDNGVPDEAEQGLDEAKERERAEIARLMDEALGIRDAERDSGVLNGDIGLAELRNEWKWRS
ncbi:hypothetical protein K437DRAFT_137715 [Tilletiaria anomala UBC 951]|uniref:Uncharacterized protein n=1 Tax=Tilletiaria anomala (strain ATCC 24038 / CBS 436.72 / UBC 951) TaxID=1037660 RepID=A0A066VSS2_TILAU|nr:uncharacterized protein K437DRAFT_137715 [Tilletiaria anomala UBC 951]KDN44511.1 hypothetical protein K437DRAFT_137715 [Tilletiaria anomala UBC 951]